MGLFGRDDKNLQPSPVTDAAAPRPVPSSPGSHASSSTTIVAAASSIEGKLVGADDLHIEGEITGEVKGAGRLVIAESGRAKAQLHASVVMVAGSVEGDVSADDRIELLPSARLTGNISAPRVIIQEGATFDGQVFMKKVSGGAPSGAKGSSTEPAADTPAPRPGGPAPGTDEAAAPEAEAPAGSRQGQGKTKR